MTYKTYISDTKLLFSYELFNGNKKFNAPTTDFSGVDLNGDGHKEIIFSALAFDGS